MLGERAGGFPAETSQPVTVHSVVIIKLEKYDFERYVNKKI